MTTSCAGSPVTTRMLPPSASPPSSSGGPTSYSTTSKPRGPWQVRLGPSPARKLLEAKRNQAKGVETQGAGCRHQHPVRGGALGGTLCVLRAGNGLDTLYQK